LTPIHFNIHNSPKGSGFAYDSNYRGGTASGPQTMKDGIAANVGSVAWRQTGVNFTKYLETYGFLSAPAIGAWSMKVEAVGIIICSICGTRRSNAMPMLGRWKM
jgi:hypothetical protein